MARYVFAPQVEGDLIAIRDFVANDNPTAALNLMRDFRAAFRLLAQRPALGHARRDLTAEPLLFWPLRGYLIIYRVRLADIEVVAVMHGARDIPTVLRRRSR